MSFLNAHTPDELRAAADELRAAIANSIDPVTSASIDLAFAEVAEARRIAPHNRYLLNDPRVRPMLDHVLRSRAGEEAVGLAPVLRCSPAYTMGDASEHERSGVAPIPNTCPVSYCCACHSSTPLTIPFWVARGRFIVQLDFCRSCALAHMEKGAIPQMGIEA